MNHSAKDHQWDSIHNFPASKKCANYFANERIACKVPIVTECQVDYYYFRPSRSDLASISKPEEVLFKFSWLSDTTFLCFCVPHAFTSAEWRWFWKPADKAKQGFTSKATVTAAAAFSTSPDEEILLSLDVLSASPSTFSSSKGWMLIIDFCFRIILLLLRQCLFSFAKGWVDSSVCVGGEVFNFTLHWFVGCL
jgi:hypothetical protein